MAQEIQLNQASEELLLDLSPVESGVVDYRVNEEAAPPRELGLLGAARWQSALKRAH